MSQKNFTNATGNWIVSDTGEISYTGTVKVEGDLQATDFLDADGNSIIRADIWVVSDPDQFGVRRVKFPDQISKPGDIYDFMIRYSSDPEQGTMSRGTINAYKIYVKDIEASSIKAPDIIASDSVQSPKVTAELVQSISSTSTKQEVLGSIVIGKIEETESFSEEQKAAAMGLNSAFKVVKSYSPAPIPDKVMVDIDKDGNITAKGVVQAADFLDSNGDSISLWTEGDDGSITRVGATDGQLAIGFAAGATSQGKNSVALGMGSGMENQGEYAVAIGWSSGQENQGKDAIAIGGAAAFNQGEGAIAIGLNAGKTDQGAHGIIISSDSWWPTESTVEGHIIIESTKGKLDFNGTDKWEFTGGPVQASDFLDGNGNSIITPTGNFVTKDVSNRVNNDFKIDNSDGSFVVSPALVKAQKFQVEGELLSAQPDAATGAFSAGRNAGGDNQGQKATALGYTAGERDQGQYGTALGYFAGRISQSEGGVAIGDSAGYTEQGFRSVAIGYRAGKNTQGIKAISIGHQAGENSQRSYSIAIGMNAGKTNQGSNGIIISAGSAEVNNSTLGHIVLNSPNGSLTFNGTNKWTFDGGPVQASDFQDSEGNPLPKSATVNNFVTLTQAQYDSLSPKDASTIYFIKEL